MFWQMLVPRPFSFLCRAKQIDTEGQLFHGAAQFLFLMRVLN